MQQRLVLKCVRDLGQELVNGNKLRRISENEHSYKQQSGKTKIVCKHLVAAYLIDHVRLRGLEVFPQKLRIIRKKNEKKTRLPLKNNFRLKFFRFVIDFPLSLIVIRLNFSFIINLLVSLFFHLKFKNVRL